MSLETLLNKIIDSMSLETLLKRIVGRVVGLNLEDCTTAERQIIQLLIDHGWAKLDDYNNVIEGERTT